MFRGLEPLYFVEAVKKKKLTGLDWRVPKSDYAGSAFSRRPVLSGAVPRHVTHDLPRNFLKLVMREFSGGQSPPAEGLGDVTPETKTSLRRVGGEKVGS